ncbi:recombinase family protein [Wolbachia endosymbiont (group A) of Pogonocherus hispidulus]|uniref:recombinase family protein n=1 Tax=Wolbachia endosymbiont (group A) of Pogonocherus hispidulus TaxID=3066136 RepID=UPI003340054B
MITVALYARVSSRSQAQNNTIESQIAELKHRIAADKHELLDECEFKDNGFSGWNLERRGLDELRDKVAEGQINKVYIHSPDRLSRKSAHQMILLDEFEKAGVEVIFLNHANENNPESKLLLGMQGLVSEYECTKIMERSRRGKLHAARKGSVSVMSKAPYGYRYIKKHVTGEARFEINEEEAKVVREVFMWIGEERISIREAVKRLREASVRTQTGKEVWHSSTIHKMLKNPAYKGQAAYGKTKAGPVMLEVKPKKSNSRRTHSIYSTDEENWIHIPVPKIVDEDLFNVVQEQLIENKQRARVQQRKETYLLQKLVVCKCCGRAYCGRRNYSKEKKIVYTYYTCLGTRNFYGNKVCTNGSIRGEVLETGVWEEVKSVLKNPDRMVKEYQCRISEDKNELLDERFARRESQLKQNIKELINDYYIQENTSEEKYISKEDFKQAMKKMKERLKEIEGEKKKVIDQKGLQEKMNLITNSIKGFYSSVKSELEQLDWQAKRSLIRTLVKEVNIDLDEVNVVFKIRELNNPAQNGQNQKLADCLRCLGTGMTKKGATWMTP